MECLKNIFQCCLPKQPPQPQKRMTPEEWKQYWIKHPLKIFPTTSTSSSSQTEQIEQSQNKPQCNKCGDTGEYEEDCSGCAMYTICYECNGTGYISNNSWDHMVCDCNNGRLHCSQCNDSGVITEDCECKIK